MSVTTEFVDTAKNIAIAAHAGQFRRDGTTPYIEHPAAVVSRVGDDPYAQAVAWLHDVLEDTDVTAAVLKEAGIPDRVIAAVEAMTKTDGQDYTAYLRHLASSPLWTTVKIADMLANLSDRPTIKQVRKYAQGLLVLTESNVGP